MRTEKFFNLYWSVPAFRGFDDLKELLPSASCHARSLLGDLRGKTVLEIGPGRGRDLCHFAQSGGQAIGVEISDEALGELKKNISKDRIGLCKMDACDLGFKDGVFDMVFLNTCLMHLNRKEFFPQIWRALKKGGRVVFVEPLKLNPFLLLYRGLLSPGRLVSPSYLRLGEIEKLGRDFSKVSHKEFYFLSPLLLGLGAVLPPLRKLIRLADCLDRLLLAIFPLLRPLSWMTVAEFRKG